MTQSAFAPAKVNLFLHVGPPGADGYHPIESWMVFADVGDRLDLFASDTLSFEAVGPFGSAIPAGGDNLVVRARDAVLEIVGSRPPRFGLRLHKMLPPASGLGGGSSDAAAALRLVGEAAGCKAADLYAIAALLGADVPACLTAHSLIARGRGESLSGAPKSPPLHAVLVNPGVAVSTAQVFAVFDAAPRLLEPLEAPDALADLDAVTEFLSGARNDLEAPAIALAPVIGQVLAVLRAAPETRLARMSGSGATCFALCADAASARALAASVGGAQPAWWVTACSLA